VSAALAPVTSRNAFPIHFTQKSVPNQLALHGQGIAKNVKVLTYIDFSSILLIKADFV
jgi:hypothetical protein